MKGFGTDGENISKPQKKIQPKKEKGNEKTAGSRNLFSCNWMYE